MRYDLHCHSIYSDGTNTVTELFDKAVSIGLSGLSITDHDTIKAYKEAFALVKNYPLKLLPGLEVSSVYNRKSVHILGYSFSPRDPCIQKFMEKIQKIRADRNLEMLNKIRCAGMPLDLSELKEDIGVVGRPHFARAMVNRGYVHNTREAFDRYIGDGEKCFVQGSRPSAQEVLDVLHEANAFGVIAHPHLMRNEILIGELLKLNFDGIEVYYAVMDSHEEEKWHKIAEKKNWIKTGGSDYHGEIKPHIDLGSSWVDEQTFELLYQRYLENERLHTTQ